MAAVDLQLPPGFRFHPTDDELVTHYLCRKCASQSIDVPIIAEIDLYKYDPWQLPGMALYGEKEWYFFSPRDRKYPNGSRPNRAAGHGYWKATGADKPIGRPKPIGIKKALVFYSGKAPKGEKTNWIMHEYRLADVDRSIRKKNNSLRLDDWVLCRVYNKKGAAMDRTTEPPHAGGHDVTSVLTTEDDTKPAILAPVPETLPMVYEDFMHLVGHASAPHLPAAAHSSCSEHVLSPEVESAPKLGEWEATAFDFPFNYIDASSLMEQMSEVYAYMTKPL